VPLAPEDVETPEVEALPNPKVVLSFDVLPVLFLAPN
jgi:hypothetical protein